MTDVCELSLHDGLDVAFIIFPDHWSQFEKEKENYLSAVF